MTLFNGGGNLANYDSGRYTSMIRDLDSGFILSNWSLWVVSCCNQPIDSLYR